MTKGEWRAVQAAREVRGSVRAWERGGQVEETTKGAKSAKSATRCEELGSDRSSVGSCCGSWVAALMVASR